MSTDTCFDIESVKIQSGSHVVFDWDNTLKLYDKKQRIISCRVDKHLLQTLKHEKQCKLYVISAISPSRMGLETLVHEVSKLGLLDIFTEPDDEPTIHAGRYARKGNLITCGYDKAEIFLELSGLGTRSEERQSTQESTGRDEYEDDVIEVDGEDYVDSARGVPSRAVNLPHTTPSVFFFDDEEVNITNFSTIVPNSKCYLVK